MSGLMFSTPLLAHALLNVALCAAGALLVGLGVRRHGLGRMAKLLLASSALNLAAMVVWYAPVLNGGDAPLSQPSVADAGWLIADVLLGLSLIHAMARRERSRIVVLDVVTIAAALLVVAGVGILGPNFAASTAPVAVQLTQACYVATDLFVTAAVLRVLLTRHGRPPALWLLVLASSGLVASDFAWNWLTIAGDYVPGSWGDIGWMVQPLLIGFAALHRSIRVLDGPAPEDAELRMAGTLLLGLALVTAPLLLGGHHLLPFVPDVGETAVGTLTLLGGSTLLSALVVLRFVLVLRRSQRLAGAAEAAVRERDELLAQSQTRYRSLVEQLPAITLVFALDADQRRVTPVYVSPQTEVVFGLSADEWETDFPAILARVHEDDRERLLESLDALIATGASPPVEFRATRADGDEIWLSDVGAMVTEDSNGRYVQTMLFDISDAKRAQAERAAMELELRHGQKLEAVGELAAGIAHEINTPTQFVGDTVRFLRDAFGDLMEMQAVQAELASAAETGSVTTDLLDRVREAEEVADLEYLRERVPGAFDRADDGIGRIGAIVSAMREFAHPPTADKAPVQLNAALENTLVVATSEYKYVADVEMDFADLPLVVCNGGDLNQVFLNLIVNAAHAIEERGADRGTIRIATKVQGDHVVVSISDTGAGIPEDVAARIFDPFFTTKEVGRGTGQGLAIARTLVVERHGGSLTFETEPGEGTTFHVTLPIGQHEPAEALAA